VKRDIYEIEEPLRLLDTEGVWRVEIREGSGKVIRDKNNNFVRYERGNVVVFAASQYVDAERAGVVGYFPRAVEIPESVLLEAADAVRAEQVPKRGEG
jgi:hypothetical protein